MVFNGLECFAPYVVLASLILLFVFLAKGRAHPVKLMLGLAVGYYLLGFLPVNGLLQSYVNPAVITLMLLLMVGLVLERTVLLNWFADKLFSQNLRATYGRMGLFIGLSSAFLNNTAVVASLLSASRNNRFHIPSKTLIPLSYIAILGGTLTLVGTSTHLLINGLMVQAGLEPFSLFDFIFVGLPLLIVGTLVIIGLAPRLLPNTKQNQNASQDYFLEAVVESNGKLVGQTIKQAGLRNLQSLFLVELIRDGVLMSPVSPDTILKPSDRLLFAGDADASNQLKAINGLSLPGLVQTLDTHNLAEVIVSHQSNLVGVSLKQANFRNKFDAAVVAINRGGETLSGKLGDVILQAGDKLLLATGNDYNQRENLSKNFYFITERKTQKGLDAKQSSIALIGFLTVLFLSAMGWVSLLDGLLVLLVAYIALRWLNVKEIRQRFPFDLFLMIGSALAIAQVMMSSGAATLIAEAVMSLFGQWGVMGAFVGVYLLTLIMTETVTNNAAAALAFPIAVATAVALDVSAIPFVLAVAYGASASFMTPYGYQTNLMVYSPGQYCFTDYVRMGLPVSVVYSATVLILTPLFFPF